MIFKRLAASVSALAITVFQFAPACAEHNAPVTLPQTPAYTGDIAKPAGSGATTIQPGVVTAAKMATGAAASNLGSAGGDLTGSFPSPTIGSGAVTAAKLAVGAAVGNIGYAPVKKTGDTMIGGLRIQPTTKSSLQLGDLGFAAAGPNPGISNPIGPLSIGADLSMRSWAPGYDEWTGGTSGLSAAEQLYIHSPLAAPASPYTPIYGRRVYALLGQEAVKSGSIALDFLNANVYSGYNNGPGNSFTCTATNGSAVLTNCKLVADTTKGPTSTNPATGSAYLFFPTVVTGGSLDAGGVPLKAADSSTMTMTTPGTFDDQNVPYLYPGTTATITVKAVSGISEINLLSHHLYALGATPGVAYYNELNTNCSQSTAATDVDSYCNGLLINLNKQAPGNTHDILHHGSSGITITASGGGYPADAFLSIGGWSKSGGSAASGADSSATYGALTGIDVGSVYSPYQNTNVRSYFKTGARLHDYEQAALQIDTPNTAHTSVNPLSIWVKPGSGNTLLGTLTDTGATLSVAPSAAVQFAVGAVNVALQTAGGTSHRTAMLFDAVPGGNAKWLLGTDKNQNGASDFFLFDALNSRFVWDADPTTGNVTFGSTIGFGTYTNAGCTNAGYITITDSAGTARKVMVCG